MARNNKGNLIGRAAVAQAAEDRERLLDQILSNPTDQDRRIARMLTILKVIYGPEGVTEIRKHMSMLNHILEPQLAAVILMKGITVEGDDLISGEILGSLVGNEIYQEITEELDNSNTHAPL